MTLLCTFCRVHGDERAAVTVHAGEALCAAHVDWQIEGKAYMWPRPTPPRIEGDE